jgi:hypothetical protein
MDFTAFTMQDHYRAVVEERERQIVRSGWLRELHEAGRRNTASCCAAEERDGHRPEVMTQMRQGTAGMR